MLNRALLPAALSLLLGACSTLSLNVLQPQPPMGSTFLHDIKGASLGVAQTAQKEFVMFSSVHTTKTTVPSAVSSAPIHVATSIPLIESSFTIPPGTYPISGGISDARGHFRTLTLTNPARGRIVLPLGDDGSIVQPLYFFQGSSAAGGLISFDPSMTQPGGIQATSGTWTITPADARLAFVDVPQPDQVTTVNYVYKGVDSGRLVFFVDTSDKHSDRRDSGNTFTTPATPGQYHFGMDTVQINTFDANSVNFTVIN